MQPSEANKIKRELLAAHAAAKNRVCRKMLSPIHQYALKYYSTDHFEEFLSLLEAKDFEGAVQHLHDKMLPYLKKNDVLHYESELMSIQVELTLTYSFPS